jgi:hypothetical protein
MTFIIPFLGVKFWGSLFLLLPMGQHPRDRPLLETVEPGAPVLLNTVSRRLYMEEQPEGWRHDSPAVLRRAYLFYSDI